MYYVDFRHVLLPCCEVVEADTRNDGMDGFNRNVGS